MEDKPGVTQHAGNGDAEQSKPVQGAAEDDDDDLDIDDI